MMIMLYGRVVYVMAYMMSGMCRFFVRNYPETMTPQVSSGRSPRRTREPPRTKIKNIQMDSEVVHEQSFCY